MFLEFSFYRNVETSRYIVVMRLVFFAIIVSGIAAVAIGVADVSIFYYGTITALAWRSTYNLMG
jgi:hypothetical protein